MNKVLKMLFVIIIGVGGTCALIWFLSSTARAQQIFSRGELLGNFIGITLLVLVGLAIYNRIKRK